MQKPSISVVMATYNGAKYLIDQLESIISQTLKPARIIVCDDNSTDGTLKILEDYAGKGLLSYHVNQNKLGVVRNFKRAASYVTNDDLIAFVDQDDIWAPNKLENLAKLMMTQVDLSKPAMVYSDANVIDKKGHLIKESLWAEFGIHPARQTFKTLLLRNIVPGCMMLINDKMKDEFLRTPPEAYMHDAWLTFIAYAYHNYAYTGSPLVKYRQHDNNVTYSISNTYVAGGFFNKIGEYAKGISLNTPFLDKEFLMAEAFYKAFNNILTEVDKEDFKFFFSLKKKNFFFKKMHIRSINKTEGA